MLVLSRTKMQSVRIGDVEVTICEVRGGEVKLGIEAPREMRVVRTELIKESSGESRNVSESRRNETFD